MRVSVYRPAGGNARLRLALTGEEYRHCSAGLTAPRLSIRGTIETGLEIWFLENKGLALSLSGTTCETSIASYKVGATDKKVSPVELPMALERNEHGPVLRTLEIPDVLLPEPALSRKRSNPQKLKENAQHLFKGTARVKGQEEQPPPPPLPEQAELVPTLAARGTQPHTVDFAQQEQPHMDASAFWNEVEGQGGEDYGLYDASTQPQPEIQPETTPPVASNVPAVVDVEHFDVPPDTPTISDLKAAIVMVNELATALGEEIVLVVENNQIRAKRKIVRFLDLE